jgi:pimeloyl-ACP methyl ester carboxylesterase
MESGALDETVREQVVSVFNDALEIHVKVAGSGPPVMFLHGGGGPVWDPFLAQLSRSRTVYAPDLPGTSPQDPHAIHKVDSFWDLLLMYQELTDALDLTRPAAIGHSLGGMIAADLAAHFPDLFSKLVLISPAGLWRDDEPVRAVDVISGTPQEAGEYLFFDPHGEVAQGFFTLPEDPDEMARAIGAAVWSQGCAAKFLWPIPEHGLAKRLHRVTVPTLIIFGEQDRLIPPVYGQDFAQRISGSRLELLDRCGHIPQAEQLERTQELVDEFLAS